ncbi:hypothetical protein DERF_008998 [Dermatophagoides farinae]|uniref:Uncharacterized protein n=1 Tax=Dermatophagoides farinae TaxID=6954 RepID=A0A922HW00_DERFA|nr:hypothetical protein DERF_008998 [Dermatophagoides farinae]
MIVDDEIVESNAITICVGIRILFWLPKQQQQQRNKKKRDQIESNHSTFYCRILSRMRFQLQSN